MTLWRDRLPSADPNLKVGTPITLRHITEWLDRHGYAGRYIPEAATFTLFMGDTHGEPTVWAKVDIFAIDPHNPHTVVLDSGAGDFAIETVVLPFDLAMES